MDSELYAQFEKRRKLWIEALRGKDPNSIHNQISFMLDDAATFSVINHARTFAPKNQDGRLQINAQIHIFINRCFFETQILRIRRLTDSNPLEGKKGVYSLVALLEDMKTKVHLFTRESLQKAIQWDSEDYGEYNEVFDVLSGSAGRERRLDDTICCDIFANLRAKLKDSCQHAIDLSNKHIAHAAPPQSRGDLVGEIRIDEIWEAHESICRTSRFIDWYILSGSSRNFSLHPGSAFFNFKFLDLPLCQSDRIGELEKISHQYDEQVDGWEAWPISDIQPKCLPKTGQ